jgi:hypothetical protein
VDAAKGIASPLMYAKTPERNRTPYQGLGSTLGSPLAFFSPSNGANLFSSPLPLFHASPFPKKNAAGSPLHQFSPGNINYESIFKSPLNTLGTLGTPGADHFNEQLGWTPGGKNFMLPGDFLSPSPRAAGKAGERSSGKVKGSDGSGWEQADHNAKTRGSQQLPGAGVYQFDNGDLLRSVLGSPAYKVRSRHCNASATSPTLS